MTKQNEIANTIDKRREISDIMEDFIGDLSEDDNRIVLGNKAKSSAKEFVENYKWDSAQAGEYKRFILEQATKNGLDAITVCIHYMLDKIVNAPTTLHKLSVPRLIMPILWELLQEENNEI